MPRLRVRNDTGARLTHVLVRVPGTPGPGVQLGPLDAGERSQPAAVPVAYAILGVEVDGDAGPARLQPFDVVGEEPIDRPEVTYTLRRTGMQLQVELDPAAPAVDP